MFSYVECLRLLHSLIVDPPRLYDVSNDVMKSVILKISNNDISGTTLCLILGACCQQGANHIAYRLVACTSRLSCHEIYTQHWTFCEQQQLHICI